MLPKTLIKHALTLGWGIYGGTLLSRYVYKRKLRAQMEILLEEELHSIKYAYGALYGKNLFENEEVARETFIKIAEQEKKELWLKEQEEREELSKIVEEHEYSRKEEKEEMRPEDEVIRTPNRPYIITFDMFQEEEHYEKVSLEYFEGDDTLIDERKRPIPRPRDIVGPTALFNFGFLSKDPSVVYVRDETKDIDFEISRNSGKYSEIILGSG